MSRMANPWQRPQKTKKIEEFGQAAHAQDWKGDK
jgi:hypothetical protein